MSLTAAEKRMIISPPRQPINKLNAEQIEAFNSLCTQEIVWAPFGQHDWMQKMVTVRLTTKGKELRNDLSKKLTEESMS